LSDFTKAENSLDFTRAENWAEGVSDFEVWDIGQVTVSNFDWLPFTPPLIAFSGPSIPDSCMHSPSAFPSRALHLAQCISNHMATRQGLLNPIGLDLIKFRTSLYADDVMLFLRPIASDVINLQLLLQQFGKATGLCINVQKSEIM
jgi:hypothetical protein